MLGSQVLEIGPADFVKGMSTSSFIADGGFAPNIGALDTQCNPQVQPGVLYGTPAEVDGDGDNVLDAGEFIIASSPDHQATGTFERILVTQRTDNSAKYYSYNGTKLADISGGTDSTNTDYDAGSTDMKVYKGATFITTKGALIKFSGSGTFNFAYATLSSYFYHPLEVFEDNLFIADGNLLKRMNTATATPTTILTLSSSEIITALGIDRGTGRLLIATVSGSPNVSNTLSSTNRLHWYDGFSNKTSKSTEVDDQIFAFYSIGNTIFVGYGQSIGYLNGSGISFLRRLRNVATADNELPYKHKFANIGNTLYVVDDFVILAFGEILPGQKVWWQFFDAGSRIEAIMPVGNNKLGVSYSTVTFSTFDVTDTSTISTFRFISNKYNFTRPILLRSIYLEYITALANASANRTLNIHLADEGYDTVNALAVEGETSLQNNSGGNLYELYPVIGFPPSKRIWGFQLNYVQTTTNWGLRRILVYYDFAE